MSVSSASSNKENLSSDDSTVSRVQSIPFFDPNHPLRFRDQDSKYPTIKYFLNFSIAPAMDPFKSAVKRLILK